MVVIRLARGGAKKRPYYHLVVTDSRNPRDGRYIERVGNFNPIARGKEPRLRINEERVKYWTSVGAKPSNRVLTLLKEFDLSAEDLGDIKAVPARKLEAKNINKAPAKPKAVKVEEASEEAQAAQASEEAKVEENSESTEE